MSDDALQRTLAGEHAAVFVLGALGGRASTLPAPLLRGAIDAAYAAHVERRDHLRVVIAATGADPVAAEPAYRLASPLDTRDQVAAEALRVERACLTTYAALVAASTGAVRRWAIAAMAATAASELALGGPPQALPGLHGH
ncbi:MAG TPA: DUF4439 domain-containing protein [Nocardioides sp.]|nr:DUF4439 domain-containing protein [Nocardioides sp.]